MSAASHPLLPALPPARAIACAVSSVVSSPMHPDEFVRHKILDAIGDLALAGAPIMGRFVGHCTGHALNNVLLRELLHNENNWFLTTVRGAHSYFGWSGAIGTRVGG